MALGEKQFVRRIKPCPLLQSHHLLRADNLVSCVVIPNELRLELRV
jgi:hypothetical protein